MEISIKHPAALGAQPLPAAGSGTAASAEATAAAPTTAAEATAEAAAPTQKNVLGYASVSSDGDLAFTPLDAATGAPAPAEATAPRRASRPGRMTYAPDGQLHFAPYTPHAARRRTLTRRVFATPNGSLTLRRYDPTTGSGRLVATVSLPIGLEPEELAFQIGEQADRMAIFIENERTLRL